MDKTSPIACREVFDENSQPSVEEITDYAQQLGIDPVSESHLLPIAKDGLMKALPKPWKAYFDEKMKAHYYYNPETKQTQWEHPVDKLYKDLVVKARTNSERDTSIHDDTYGSLQDLLTSEEYSKIKSKSEQIEEDYSVESSISDENPQPRKPEPKQLVKLGLLNDPSLSRKPPPCPVKPLKKQHSEIIDLSINLNSPDFKEQSGPKFERGISLTGKGAMFLKSRTQEPPTLLSPEGDKSFSSSCKLEQPKSILREHSNDDKKSVRFNLDAKLVKEVTSSSNSSSVNDKESVLSNEQTPHRDEVDMGTLRSLSSVKLAPINLGSTGVSIGSQDNQLKQKRLIKPPAADFIKPNLFQKKFNKISDFIKPISMDDDSDNDFDVRPRSPLIPQKNKISINLMESIESEVSSSDSPKDENNDDSDSYKHMNIPVKDVPFDKVNEKFNKSSENSVNLLNKNLDNERKLSSAQGNNESSTNESESTNEQSTEPVKVDSKIKNDLLANDIKQGMNALMTNNNIKDESLVKDELEMEMNAKLNKLKSELETEYKAKERDLRLSFEVRYKNFEEEIVKRHADELNALKNRLDATQNDQKINIDDKISMIEKQNKAKLDHIIENIRLKFEEDKESIMKEERAKGREEAERVRGEIARENEAIVGRLKEQYYKEIQGIKIQMEKELESARRAHNECSENHRQQLQQMQKQHNALLDRLRAEYRDEVTALRSSQAAHIAELQSKHPHDLTDKYRCLKEKYARLKHDVKMSIERRNKRREQALATGSETEKSNSNKTNNAVKNKLDPPKSPSESSNNNCELKSNDYSQNNNNKIKLHLDIPKDTPTDMSPDQSRSAIIRNKSPIGRLLSRENRNSSDNEMSLTLYDTSVSHSDSRTLSKKVVNKNCNVGSDGDKRIDSKKRMQCFKSVNERAETDYHDSSDACDDKNNIHGLGKRKSFTRIKSASTSRLNYSPKRGDRSCSPVENLRQQLRKLEDLEDQFPDLNVDTSTYRLRYPFGEAGVWSKGCGELEFVRHRTLVERERVRRARAAIRERAHTLALTREQEDIDLTELEVSLHRARALLGEKVIRLRRIEAVLRALTEQTHQEQCESETWSESSETSEQIQQQRTTQPTHANRMPVSNYNTNTAIPYRVKIYEQQANTIHYIPLNETDDNVLREKAKQLRDWLHNK